MTFYYGCSGVIKKIAYDDKEVNIEFYSKNLNEKLQREETICLNFKSDKSKYIKWFDNMKCDIEIEDDSISLLSDPLITPSVDVEFLSYKMGLELKMEKRYLLNFFKLIKDSLETDNNYEEKICEILCDVSYEYVKTQNNELLRTFKLITEEEAKKIFNWWNENISRRRILLLLTQEEIDTSRIDINDLYLLCRANPNKIPSISEDKCQEIMKMFNISETEISKRNGKVVRYIFHKINKNGWTCVPHEIIKKKFPHIEKYDNLENYLVYSDEYGYYLDFSYEAENNTVSVIQKLVNSKVNILENIEFTNTDLSKSQRECIEVSLNNGITITTGGAGTGKTTCIEEICLILEKKKINFQICAFTGKAVSRINEKLAERGSKTQARTMDSIICSGIHGLESNKFSYLIIDESSMVSIELFHKFCAIFTFDSLILFGDSNQLQPINFGCFYEQLIFSNTVKIIKLKENFRTYIDENKEIKSGIILNSNNILKAQGNFSFEMAPDFSIFEGNLTDLEKMIHGLKDVDINEMVILTPMNVHVKKINLIVQKIINKNKLFSTDNFKNIWKKEDKIMVIKNGNEVFNGQFGTIKNVFKEAIQVSFTNIDIMYPFRRKNYSSPYISDITLGYCLTVDKSQGSEWKIVILYIEDDSPFLLNKNRIYTAITRAKVKFICICKDRRVLENACLREKPFRYENFGNKLKKVLPQLENNIEQLFEKNENPAIEMDNTFEYSNLLKKFEDMYGGDDYD